MGWQVATVETKLLHALTTNIYCAGRSVGSSKIGSFSIKNKIESWGENWEKMTLSCPTGVRVIFVRGKMHNTLLHYGEKIDQSTVFDPSNGSVAF
jgi:hypothetical protein